MRHDVIFRCISTMQTLAVSASFLEESQFSTTSCPSPVASDRASWSLSLEKPPWICYDLQIESNRARIKTGHHPMLTLLNPLALPRVVIHSFRFFFSSFNFYHLWTFICLWNWDIQLAKLSPMLWLPKWSARSWDHGDCTTDASSLASVLKESCLGGHWHSKQNLLRCNWQCISAFNTCQLILTPCHSHLQRAFILCFYVFSPLSLINSDQRSSAATCHTLFSSAVLVAQKRLAGLTAWQEFNRKRRQRMQLPSILS